MKNTKYDFQTVILRKNTNSLKWDLFDDELPMWVADMDFEIAPEIHKALENRLKHPVFAYTIEPDELFDAYVNWWDRRYDFKMNHDDLMFFTGVMPSITSIIRALTQENDKILIQTPVYHVFFYVIEDNNREIVENRLKYENGAYSIDWDDLDNKLNDVEMFILCNPHNPIGKIWSCEDLAKIGELCRKHDVILVSDEIHCDLTDPGKTYNPFEKTSDYDKAITCISPTKTFNIAGLQNAMIHTKNSEYYNLIKKQRVTDFFHHPNAFSNDATIAAYNNSEEWLEDLRQVLYDNKIIVDEFLKNELPVLKLVPCEATYLLWIDCSELNISSKVLSEFLRKNQGVFFSPGVQFGENGDDFLRVNIACPQELLINGMERLKAGVIALNNINKF